MVRTSVKRFEKLSKLEESSDKRRKVFEVDKKKIKRYRDKGYSFYEIGEKLGVSMTAARYWYIKKYEPEKFEKDKEKRSEVFKKWYSENK